MSTPVLFQVRDGEPHCGPFYRAAYQSPGLPAFCVETGKSMAEDRVVLSVVDIRNAIGHIVIRMTAAEARATAEQMLQAADFIDAKTVKEAA